MKKILLGIALLCSATVFAFHRDIDDIIAQRFKESFPAAKNVKWYSYRTFHEVLFNYNQVACRIQYDLKGNVMAVRRDYGEKDLPVFILAKVKQRYPNKKVFGVTEIGSSEGVIYEIILEDAKTWTRVTSDDCGMMTLTRKYRKA